MIRLDLEHPDDLAGADVGAGQPVDELGRGAQRGDEEGRVAVERNQLTGRDPAVDREPVSYTHLDVYKRQEQETIDPFRVAVEAGIAAGVFRPVPAELVAHNLKLAAHGWALKHWDCLLYTSRCV